ncbi:MAG: hypothetical protein L3J71_12905 [Victivallaceae bacterium]|nr:hypothetical protein [Victivallaceae bacterium]
MVLLIDEIDALVGDMRQLRSGYDKRPENFPQAVILCGVRDVKDYRIHRSDGDIITGGSCFNIKAESLTLGNFSETEVRELYNEHTETTGQQFDAAVFPLIMRYTGGQPWLVNALAYEVTFKMKKNRNSAVIITEDKIIEAKERLILACTTHLGQLADKLKEERVRRFIEPLLIGENSQAIGDDIEYSLDLGLIKRTSYGLVIANEIYQEVLPRELAQKRQDDFLSLFHPELGNEDQSLNSSGARIVIFGVKIWRVISTLHHI